MIKTNRIVILGSLLWWSCQRASLEEHAPMHEPVIKPTYDSVRWLPEIRKVIDSFVDEVNCRNCIYELYINKVLPRYSIINIKARSSSTEYMNGKNPLFMTDIKGRRFYIYTGFEDFFVGDRKKVQIDTDTSGTVYKNWTIMIKGDSLKINKNGSYPFFPSDDESPEKFAEIPAPSRHK